MKHLLDSPSTYLRYDPKNALNSIETLPDQCVQAWRETKAIQFPVAYKQCDNIVIAGMGGSGLGAHIVRGLYKNELKVPFEISNDYTLPGYVNSRSLVIVVSYSGSTEEIVATLKDARTKKAKVVVVASGSKLAVSAKKNSIPAYIFNDEKTNIAGQPRMGVGLTFFGLIGILKQLNYIKLTDKEVSSAIDHMRALDKKWNGTVSLSRNPAKKLADQLHGKMPVYVGSEHLFGNTRALRNQTHENAKAFACNFDLPELNHHLMEGLAHPSEKRALHFVLLSSKLYDKRTQKRYAITKTVIKKNGVDVATVELDGNTKLEQTLEVLQFGGYVTFYMAMLNKLDPTLIPYVDFFKEQIK